MTRHTEIPPELLEQAEILCDQYRAIQDDREFLARCLMADRAGRDDHVIACGLTRGQLDLLKFYREFKNANGHTPSYGEAAKALGIVKSRVHTRLHQLEERGFVALQPGRARSVSIVAVPIGDVSSAHLSKFEA